jgi:hypothetical protein
MLSKQQITDAFINAHLEENYNFLEEDLIKLANAFVEAARPMIMREERANCVRIAKSLNHFVAQRILEIRAQS